METQEKTKTEVKKPSICQFVLTQFEKNPKIETDDLIEKVQNAAKDGKLRKNKTQFSKTHVVWYRYQIRKGIYRDKVSKECLEGMKLPKPQKASK